MQLVAVGGVGAASLSMGCTSRLVRLVVGFLFPDCNQFRKSFRGAEDQQRGAEGCNWLRLVVWVLHLFRWVAPLVWFGWWLVFCFLIATSSGNRFEVLKISREVQRVATGCGWWCGCCISFDGLHLSFGSVGGWFFVS